MTDVDPPSLARAFDSPAAKRRYVRRLFGVIADRYDVITRLLSFGLDQRWKRRLLDLLPIAPHSRALDLACGTGDLAFMAASRGAVVVGLDFAPRMIDLARRRPVWRPDTKSSRRDGAVSAVQIRPVTWTVGDMGCLPIASCSVDVVTTGYGLRNVPDLAAAIHEIRRVLRPGGTLGVLDFDRPSNPAVRAVYLTYLTVVGAALGTLLHGDPDTYRYIPASIRRYPGARQVANMLARGGFADVRHVRVLGGLMAIHVARRASDAALP
jgi:demethylmenaquinone methyltransferase/2-methoxy-6-polyprenyl-1,4-benzoquinol methylase